MGYLCVLVGPSASGKSYLAEHIRKSGAPFLVSTTTRAQRPGEVEGVDYYFISHDESVKLEEDGKLAELLVYNGNRYGITLDEFNTKLSNGATAFMIAEAKGVNEYVHVAKENGHKILTFFVHVDDEVRLERFLKRTKEQIESHREDMVWGGDSNYEKRAGSFESLKRDVFSALDRLQLMLTVESKWFAAHQWTRVLDGTLTAEQNFAAINKSIEDEKRIISDYAAFYQRPQCDRRKANTPVTLDRRLG